MSWNYADINGAMIFTTQEECIMPMMKYNKILRNDKYVFVCEPYVPEEIMEEPVNTPNNDGEQKLEELLDKFKDDTLNKPDTKGTGNDIFKNLGLPEPRGMDV